MNGIERAEVKTDFHIEKPKGLKIEMMDTRFTFI